jgi:hypothetical protein
VDYRIGVYEMDGTLIYLASPIRMICLTSPCSYTLRVQETGMDYSDFLKVQYNLDFNETTNMWLFTYNDPTQTTSKMNLSVYQITGTNTVLVCNNYLTAYTGSINCNTTGYSGTLKAIVTREASPGQTITSKIVEIINRTFNNSFGLIISLVIAVIIVFIFSFVNPILAIIGGIIALIPAWFLGAISWPIIAGFIVIGLMIVYMMRRQI